MKCRPSCSGRQPAVRVHPDTPFPTHYSPADQPEQTISRWKRCLHRAHVNTRIRWGWMWAARRGSRRKTQPKGARGAGVLLLSTPVSLSTGAEASGAGEQPGSPQAGQPRRQGSPRAGRSCRQGSPAAARARPLHPLLPKPGGERRSPHPMHPSGCAGNSASAALV